MDKKVLHAPTFIACTLAKHGASPPGIIFLAKTNGFCPSSSPRSSFNSSASSSSSPSSSLSSSSSSIALMTDLEYYN